MKDVEIRGVPGHKIDEEYLGAELARLLDSHYPGWGWAVEVNSEKLGGVVEILSEMFEGINPLPHPWGIRIPLSEVYADPSRRRVVYLAGMMLEFCGLPKRYKDDEIIRIDEFLRNYQTYQYLMSTGWRPKD